MYSRIHINTRYSETYRDGEEYEAFKNHAKPYKPYVQAAAYTVDPLVRVSGRASEPCSPEVPRFLSRLIDRRGI